MGDCDLVAKTDTTTDATSLPSLNIVACPGLLDRGNPYTQLTYGPMGAFGGNVREFSFYRPVPTNTQILHVHWPERIFWGRISKLHPILSAAHAHRLLGAMKKVRRNGGFVVWTAHNIKPHESFGPARDAMWPRYFEKFREEVDLVISLSSQAYSDLITTYPDLRGRRSAIIPHPHYTSAYPKPLKRGDARKTLDLSADLFVLLAAGTLRKSKGVVELAECFAQIARPDEILLIAGACDPDCDALTRLQDIAAASRGSVLLDVGWIPDKRVATLFSAADLAIFNFNTILNSGSVLLSLSFNTPVCAPELGSLKELSAKLGRRWFFPLIQPLSNAGLRTTLDSARVIRETVIDSEIAPLNEFDPAAIAMRIYGEYAAIIHSQSEKLTL